MLTLSGMVLGCTEETTAKGQKVKKVQVLNNGGKYKSILSVVDWDCRSWPEGEEIEMSVVIKANVSRDGQRAFINYTAISDKE